MTLERTVVIPGMIQEYAAFAELLSGLSDDQWAAPSRCEEWAVADVAGHVVGQLVDVSTLRLEGLGTPENLNTLQQAFKTEHGLQCGFCTPGFLMLLTALLRENPHPSDDEIRDVVASNLCRCTGYAGILRAARLAADSGATAT